MKIYKYPADILKQKAKDVDDAFLLSLPSIIEEMHKTMLDNNGLGLAAPQVGISRRFFIIQIPEQDKLMVFINPKLTPYGDMLESEEGCLSLPGVSAFVRRYEKVKIEYYDIDFRRQSLDADGLLAIAIQHEYDHLDGILYIDRLSTELKSKVLKEYKEQNL